MPPHFTRSRCMVAFVAVLGLVGSAMVLGQTPTVQPSARGTDDMPLSDYLGLLRQISPAAEEGARTYLAALQRRCGRNLRTEDLRQAISQGDGDPVLMGLIRASHLRDTSARDQWVQQLRCTPRQTR